MFNAVILIQEQELKDGKPLDATTVTSISYSHSGF